MAIKRVLCVVLSLVILAGCLMVGTWAETEIDPKTDSVKTVYVSDGGSSENNGLTRETPVPYLNTAIKIINDAAAADPAIKQGKIVLVGDITPGVTSSYNFGELTQLDPYEIPLTVARIDRETGGQYVILPLHCHTTEGPLTHGTYIWGEFEDLQAVEDKLLDGPYIHHFVEMQGDYRKEIREFCKYFPNLKVDRVENDR